MNRRHLDIYNIYVDIKNSVIDRGYQCEIEWQENQSIDNISESEFLRESAWVILSSGMREAIIQKIFPRISHSFFEWESAVLICDNKSRCKRNALKYFNHKGKINAIVDIATSVNTIGFEIVRNNIVLDGIQYLTKFPYIGPTTSFHLAKNLGLQVAKPDRHLKRIANILGYNDPQELCSDIASISSDKISVVDIVLWRYATINQNYIDYLRKMNLSDSVVSSI